jgi:hypothetical protein
VLALFKIKTTKKIRKKNGNQIYQNRKLIKDRQLKETFCRAAEVFPLKSFVVKPK